MSARVVGASVVLAVLPIPAFADSWTTEPTFTVGGEYSSNPTVAQGGDSGQAAVTTGSLPLEWAGGIHHLTLAPKVRIGASGGASGLGADGYYLSGSYHALSSRFKLEASGSVSDDSSIIRQPDAGTLVREPIRQHGASGQLSTSYDLTERDSLEASLSVRNQRYGIRPNVGLYDFNYDSAMARYTRLFAEEHAVFLSSEVVRYRIPGYDYRTDSVNASIGAAGVFAQIWQYRLHAGRSRLSTPSSAEHPTGSLYAVQLDRAGERSQLAFSIVQSLQPSGFGTLVLSREATARFEWTASERLKFSLAARRAQSSDVFYSFALTERRYNSLAAGSEWTLTERWNTRLDVSYVKSTFDGLFSGGWTAHAVSVSLGLSRRFARFSLT